MSNPVGRPRKELDFEEFEKLCLLQCTERELCAWFEMNSDTLQKRVEEHYGANFSEVFQEKKAKGHMSLRRRMYQRAMEGSDTMMIYMSKQKSWLGWSDRQTVEQTPTEGKLVIDLSGAFKEEEKDDGTN